MLLAVILPATSFAGPSDIGSAFYGATVDGWRNTLAATLPIDPGTPEPLGFVTVVAWLVGSVTGSLLVTSKQAVIPIIPPVLFAALALPLGAPNGVAAWLLIVVLVGAALLFALVRAVPQTSAVDSTERVTEFVGERMLTERLLSGLPILLALGLIAPLLPRSCPAGPRNHSIRVSCAKKKCDQPQPSNPLAEIKARQSSDDEAFLLEVAGGVAATEFDRMGFVALEIYNGANWTTASTYRSTSADLEVLQNPNVETLEVRQRVELINADLPWIPAGDQVIRIEADDIWYDPESGTLLSRSGPRDIPYQAVSRLARPTEDDLRGASLDLSDSRYLELPSIPADSLVNGLGDRLEGGSDYDRLLALETALQTDFRFLTDEASGTSLGRLEEFLGQRGWVPRSVRRRLRCCSPTTWVPDAELWWGIASPKPPRTTRFVSSRPSDRVNTTRGPKFASTGLGGLRSIRFRQPVAWAVSTTTIQRGFPKANASLRAQPRSGPNRRRKTKTRTTKTSSPRPFVYSWFRASSCCCSRSCCCSSSSSSRPCAAAIVPSLEDPAERLLAGWQESKDRLLEAGVEIRQDMTVKEIVSASRHDLGVHASSSLATLAPHVTSTIYSPIPPTSELADLVWEEVELFDRQLNETRSRVQTAKAKLDPRPLIETV